MKNVMFINMGRLFRK
jgi:hypothetical protein